MSERSIPTPADATALDHLQAALYPWLGRPEWWPADFPGDELGQPRRTGEADVGDDR